MPALTGYNFTLETKPTTDMHNIWQCPHCGCGVRRQYKRNASKELAKASQVQLQSSRTRAGMFSSSTVRDRKLK